VQWTYLGHASWLVECGSARVIFDPVLGEDYHDGIFEVYPRREVDLEALNPTVIVVSHRHPDHFDLPSLARLARRSPDARVITSDALVVEACQSLGFARVERVVERSVVELSESLRMFTTPSHCRVEEWGVLLAGPEGTVWNLIDSAVRSPEDVAQMRREAAEALGLAELGAGPDVAIVRWCPLRQVEFAVGGELGFPAEGYAMELRNAAATGASTLIPGSCGDRYAGWGAWQNRLVYPVTEQRFLADLGVLRPDALRFAPRVGQGWRLESGRAIESGPVPWVEVLTERDERLYAPFVVPEIVDPAPVGFDEEAALVEIAVWVGDVLAPALQQWVSARCHGYSVVWVLELVFPTRVVALTLRAGDEVRVELGSDPHHDGLDRIAGSVMLAVLRGQKHWGWALLGGWMRSVRRAVRMQSDGALLNLPLPTFIVYAGLSYPDSTERWVRSEVARLLNFSGDRAEKC